MYFTTLFLCNYDYIYATFLMFLMLLHQLYPSHLFIYVNNSECKWHQCNNCRNRKCEWKQKVTVRKHHKISRTIYFPLHPVRMKPTTNSRKSGSIHSAAFSDDPGAVSFRQFTLHLSPPPARIVWCCLMHLKGCEERYQEISHTSKRTPPRAGRWDRQLMLSVDCRSLISLQSGGGWRRRGWGSATMQEQRPAVFKKNEKRPLGFSLDRPPESEASIKAVLPSSGESWEITWTLDCIAAKKKEEGRSRTDRRGRGGLFWICLYLLIPPSS